MQCIVVYIPGEKLSRVMPTLDEADLFLGTVKDQQEFRNSEILAMSGVRCKYMDK